MAWLKSYSACLRKRKDIRTHTTPWVCPEDIKLCEKVSHKNTNTIRFHFHEEASRMVVARAGGRGKGNCCLMSAELVLQDEKHAGDWLHDNVNVLNHAIKNG